MSRRKQEPTLEPLTVSRKVAAQMLSVSTETLRQWVNAGDLTPMRTPKGHPRYAVEMLRAFVRRQTGDQHPKAEAAS